MLQCAYEYVTSMCDGGGWKSRANRAFLFRTAGSAYNVSLIPTLSQRTADPRGSTASDPLLGILHCHLVPHWRKGDSGGCARQRRCRARYDAEQVTCCRTTYSTSTDTCTHTANPRRWYGSGETTTSTSGDMQAGKAAEQHVTVLPAGSPSPLSALPDIHPVRSVRAGLGSAAAHDTNSSPLQPLQPLHPHPCRV